MAISKTTVDQLNFGFSDLIQFDETLTATLISGMRNADTGVPLVEINQVRTAQQALDNYYDRKTPKIQRLI